MKRLLVVVAHPDDEVLGAGALMYRVSQEGGAVYVCVMDGTVQVRSRRPDDDALEQDIASSADFLGVRRILKGNFPNIRMNTVPHLELVQFIESAIEETQPDIVVTHHPADTNNDHLQTSLACQAAIRLFQRRPEIPSIKEFWYMEVPSATDWSVNRAMSGFTPNTFIETGKEGILRKIEALSQYRGVMRAYPHPRSETVLLGLAACRGAQAGLEYAEAFECAFRREAWTSGKGEGCMRAAFATCVQLGRSCIEEIYRIGGRMDLLITLKDERAREKSGRIYLDDLAEEHQVPLLKIDNINESAVIDTIKAQKIDWLFIIGWSQIAKPELLNAPAKGCIGMHPTLLPVGRGRASIPWAILKGLSQTGVTMFKLDEGVDTGDIIGQRVIALSETVTATELYEQVNQAQVELIARYWPDIVAGTVQLHPQDHRAATQWPGRKPENGRITGSMTMQEADRMVRAVTHPYPGAFYREGDQILRIWSGRVSPEEGRIRLKDGWLEPLDFEVESEH